MEGAHAPLSGGLRFLFDRPTMTDNERRKFLRMGLAMVGTGSLAACGGGGGDSGVGSEGETAQALGAARAAPATALIVGDGPPAAAAVALPASTGNMQFTVLGGLPWLAVRSVNVRAVPFALGYAFKRGDVPAGSTVFASSGSLQVTPRNFWPDGSLRFAQLAGHVDLSAGVGAVVTLSVGLTAATGSAMTTAHLKRTGIRATIGCGSFGSVSWADTNWDTPFQTWASGPEMSSWIYRKPVASDAHLVAWMELRLFAGGAVEVLPWVENGYMRVAAPSNRNTNFSFTIGTRPRFSQTIDLKHHQRTPLVSGSALSHWLDTDPVVTVHHDRVYLQATELVPTYSAQVPATSSLITLLPATYAPLQAGSFRYDSDNMGSSGYQDPIGLLPQHDVLCLTSDSSAVYGAVVRNGYSAGRYGIHYRDEATNRPPRFSQWRTLVIADGQGIKDNGASTTNTYTAAATGGNPPTWDIAHSPSVGFVAYLLTGRFYFMEEVQFAATLNGLMMTDWVRAGGGAPGYNPAPGYTGSSCVFATALDSFQTRSSAWGLRTLAQALCVTPTADALHPELLASMEDNCRHFHQTYVAQPNNPYGMIAPGESYNGGTRELAVWQQDFVTAAWGYAKAMGLPLSSTGELRMTEFFAWKAKGTIFRLGQSSGFWYVNANAYTAKISGANSPDYLGGTGPWYTTDAQCYAATYPSVGSYMSTTEGTLGFDFGSAPDSAKALWANIQPALAYAVRHGVPGAREGYDRMVDTNNFFALVTAFNERPVWSVKPAGGAQPATGAQPAWLAGKPLNTWFQIPGTGGPGAGLVTNAFSDMTLRPSDSSLLVVAAGGHSDGSSNAAAKLVLSADAPSWVTLRESSTPTANVVYYGDGRPTARHTYHHTHYIASRDSVLLAGCRYGFGGSTQAGPGMDVFDLGSKDYLPRLTYPDIPSGGGYGVAQDGEGNIWTQSGHKFTVATATWSKPGNGSLLRYPAAYDALRKRIFALQWWDGEGYSPGLGLSARELNPATGDSRDITFRASAGLAAFQAAAPSYAGMAYCPTNGKFYFLHPGEMGFFYVITPNDSSVWDIDLVAAAGSIPVTSGLLCKRFLWVPALNGFVLQANSNNNLYFMRIA